MKKLLLISFIVLISSTIAKSQIIAVESFDYEIGADLFSEEGGEGWTGTWAQFWEGDPLGFTIVEPGLLPEGVDIALKGNRLRGEVLTATGFRIRRELAAPIIDDGSEIWISFIIESENAIGASWQGVSLWTPTEGSAGELNLFGKNWTPVNYGVVVKGAGIDTEIPVESNVPVWLVVKIELSGDETAENFYLWVNPDPTTEPITEEASAVNSGLLDADATHIACHFGNTVGIVVYFDELMVANTFEEVVPKETVGISTNHISSKISSCYPNPFSNSTSINYNVIKNGLVSLDIYNAIGEKVETLMNGMQSQGNYSIQWNAKDLASGVYFYKLTVGNVTETNKIILK